MTLAIECPSCRAELKVPDHLAGKRIRCKTCREEFRVKSGGRSGDYDDEPRPRRKSPSPLVPILIVGGIVAGCLVIAVVVIVLIARSAVGNDTRQPFANGQPVPQPFGAAPAIPQPVQQRAQHTVTPLHQMGRLGRPANPPEGPMVVTLSNPRLAENPAPGRSVYLVDYQAQGAQAGANDWYYLLVKGQRGGIGQAVLFRLDDKPSGTISFSFFTFDPGEKFEVWIEREPFGQAPQRKRASKAVAFG